MANNVPITAGSGTTVATDEVVDATLGTVQVQYVKLMDGTNDGTSRVQVGSSGGLSVKGASLPGTSGSIAAAGTGTVGPLNVADAGNVTFVVKNTTAGTAFAGSPVVLFEQSDDNVSWAALNVVRSTDTAVASSFTVAPVGANGSIMFDGAVEGVNWVRARVTTGPTTNPMTVAIVAGGMPFTPALAVVPKRDVGRSSRAISVNHTSAASAETLMTLNISADLAAATTGTNYTVTAGRRFRIQAITLWFGNASGNTAAFTATFRIRGAASGATSATSPLQFQLAYPLPAAGNTVSPSYNIAVPDGWELPGGSTFALTYQQSAYTATTQAGLMTVLLNGFEY